MGGRGGRTTNFYRRDEKASPSTPVTVNSPGKPTEGMPRAPAHTGLSPVPGLDAEQFSLSPSQVEAATTRGAKGQSRRCTASSPKPTLDGSNGSHNGSWERRRGGSRMDGGGVLSKIHDLADHLRNNVRVRVAVSRWSRFVINSLSRDIQLGLKRPPQEMLKKRVRLCRRDHEA